MPGEPGCLLKTVLGHDEYGVGGDRHDLSVAYSYHPAVKTMLGAYYDFLPPAAEPRIDDLIEVQAFLIDLLYEFCMVGIEEEVEDAARYVIEKLQTTKRCLLRADLLTVDIQREVEHASEYLTTLGNDLQTKHLEWMTTIRERLVRLSSSLVTS